MILQVINAVIKDVIVNINIHIIKVRPKVSKNIANTSSDIRATIPATIKGHLIISSAIIENIITKSNPTTKPIVNIKIPPF